MTPLARLTLVRRVPFVHVCACGAERATWSAEELPKGWERFVNTIVPTYQVTRCRKCARAALVAGGRE